MTDDVSVWTSEGIPLPDATEFCSIVALSCRISSAWTSSSPNKISVAWLVEASTRFAMLANANVPFLPSIRMACLIKNARKFTYVCAKGESYHFSQGSFISSFKMNWT